MKNYQYFIFIIILNMVYQNFQACFVSSLCLNFKISFNKMNYKWKE
jgi:hypothetical protein